jgi:hypothetical protein
MLGEKISEEAGKVTGQRVLAGDAPRMEVSFQATGKQLGVDVTDTGTYIAVVRPNGTLFGEGQGIQMTKDGDTILWQGNGVGRFNANGGVSWRGAIYYQTQSQKFARLNGVAGIFESETDAAGNTKASVFEWR